MMVLEKAPIKKGARSLSGTLLRDDQFFIVNTSAM